MGRTNIKIVDEVHEGHNERRQELGLSWSEYLRRCEYDADDGGDDLQDLHESVQTVEERTGRIERQLETMGAGR